MGQKHKRLRTLIRKYVGYLQPFYSKVQSFFAQHNFLRRLTIGLGGLFGVILLLSIIFHPLNSQFERVGTSFSVKYARELGINWQDAYLALLDDIGIKYLRLMSYWDEYEKTNDQFNFADLDWQMNEAAKRGVKVSLAVGLRQPRWPECHFPDWARKMTPDQWQPELMQYIETVVKRYRNHPALSSYQLENEALNQWFGECFVHQRDELKRRLTDEVNLIKRLDKAHPVYMSLSDQHGLPLGEPTPDRYGYSVYRIVYNSQIVKGYFIYPTPIWYHRMRGWLIKTIKHRGDIFIHELQLEPWGPGATTQLPIPEQDRSMSVKQMYKNVDFARQIGYKEVYLWGSEWWYWRKNILGDDDPWIAAKDIVRQINQGYKFTIPQD